MPGIAAVDFIRKEIDMNKLTALSKLANAYNTLKADRTAGGKELTLADADALFALDYNFGNIRRSLRIEDLKPATKEPVEVLNPPGPRFF
jgi:hypothetical protein